MDTIKEVNTIKMAKQRTFWENTPKKYHKLLQEYNEWLDTTNYAETTKYSYFKGLENYIKHYEITNKTELTQKIVNSKKSAYNISGVKKWLNLPSVKHTQRKTTNKQTIQKKTGYSPRNDPLVQQLFKERNIKPTTCEPYISALLKYIPLIGFKNLKEMINEALEDERKRVPIKEARISQHLRQWRSALIDDKTVKSNGTVHAYYSKIETVYRHFNVTVPQRPPMKLEKQYHVSYYDLPDKEMIETAINQTTLEMKSLILFMSSSGTAKAETLGITVGKFIDGLREYTKSDKPQYVIEELKGRKDVVPTIALVRKKTNVPYYTCCSPEATYYILQYMEQWKKFDRECPLWDMNGSYVMKHFQIINDNNNWGKIGPYRRFRTHTLRKFHASNLGCSFDVINTLEGRTNGTIHETYVKQKPDQLKKVYMEHMCNVMIHPEQFIGPHCGGEREEEKIKNSIKELVPDLVPTLEHVQQQTRVVQPSMVQQAPFDYNILKDIARLETRMDAIEQRLEKLGG